MNYSNKVIAMLLFLLLSFGVLRAQTVTGKDKIEVIKIGFLTEKINLSKEQAALFWPIYNEYTQKKKEIKAKSSQLLLPSKLDQLTDEQVNTEIKMLQALRKDDVDLDVEYMAKFGKILTPRQVAGWYQAEKEFVKILLKKLE